MTTLTHGGFALSNKHVSKDLYCCADNTSHSLDFEAFQVRVCVRSVSEDVQLEQSVGQGREKKL